MPPAARRLWSPAARRSNADDARLDAAEDQRRALETRLGNEVERQLQAGAAEGLSLGKRVGKLEAWRADDRGPRPRGIDASIERDP